MRILALETSGSSGSVAALQGPQLVLEQPLPSGSRSAQSLAPGIESLLAEVGWPLGQIDLIAVTQGPGSFTGLRIGVTTAKALAYAVEAQVIGINTLEVIARQRRVQQIESAPAALWAVLDAQRGELFAARFPAGMPNPGRMLAEVLVIAYDDWLTRLAAGEAVSGPGLQRSVSGIRPSVTVVDRQFWLPQAETVGRLGHEQFLAGRRDDPFHLCPQYFRRAAAEEQWQRTSGSAG